MQKLICTIVIFVGLIGFGQNTLADKKNSCLLINTMVQKGIVTDSKANKLRENLGCITETVTNNVGVCGPSGICRNLLFAKPEGQNLKADVYLPTNNLLAKSPAIIYFFPGSWMSGSKDSCLNGSKPQWFVDAYRQEGYAFVCVDYRLTNQAIFPAQLYDAKVAVRWLKANANKYNIDSSKIGVLGWSAGGHLALMLGATVGQSAYEGNLGYADQLSSVSAVVSLVGPAYFIPPTNVWTDGSQNNAFYAYMGGNPEKSQAAMINAINATIKNNISGNEPPFLLQYGSKDTLVKPFHGQSVNEAIKAKGGTAQFKIYNGGHGDFDWYPDQIAFFNKFLKTEQIKKIVNQPATTSSSTSVTKDAGSDSNKAGVIQIISDKIRGWFSR